MAGRVLRALGPIFLAGFLAYGYNNGFYTLAPSFCLELGASPAASTAQGTVLILAAVAMRLYFGPLADRRGTRFVMAVGLAGFVAGGAAFLLAEAYWQVVCARLLQAVGLAAFFPAATAHVSRAAPEGRTGLALGAYRFVTAGALLVWPQAAFALAASHGYGAAFALLTGLAVAALAAVGALADDRRGAAGEGDAHAAGCADEADAGARAASAEEARAQDATTGAIGAADPSARAAHGAKPARARMAGPVAAAFAIAVGYGLVFSSAAGFVGELLPHVNAGLYFSLFGIGGMVVNLVAGWLSDAARPQAVAAVGMALMGAGVALLAALPIWEGAWVASGIAAGLGYSCAFTSLLVHIARHTSEERRAASLAWQQNAIDLGIAAGSAGAGALVAAAGAPAAFAGCGALLLAAALAFAAGSRGD